MPILTRVFTALTVVIASLVVTCPVFAAVGNPGPRTMSITGTHTSIAGGRFATDVSVIHTFTVNVAADGTFPVPGDLLSSSFPRH